MDAITSVPELRQRLDAKREAARRLADFFDGDAPREWIEADKALHAALNNATLYALLTAAEAGYRLRNNTTYWLMPKHGFAGRDYDLAVALEPLFPEAAMRRPSTEEEAE